MQASWLFWSCGSFTGTLIGKQLTKELRTEEFKRVLFDPQHTNPSPFSALHVLNKQKITDTIDKNYFKCEQTIYNSSY